MKGAIADPSTSTSSPPSTQTMTITGVNQYFLRLRRKSQNSLIKSSIDFSKLLGHRGLSLALRGAVKPITRPLRLETQAQRIVAGPPHDHAHRGQHRKEQYGHDHRADDPGKSQRQPSPSAVERAQQRSGKNRGHEKG